MKLAYPVATPEVSGPLLAWSGEVEVIAASLHSLGYSGVELFVRDPSCFDAAALAGTLRRHGLEVAAVGTGPVAVHDRLCFTDPDPDVRRRAVERTCVIIDFAARFGAQVNVGKLRGNTRGTAQGCAWRDEAFRTICAHAADRSIEITLEPQHRGIIDNLNGTLESVNWVRSLGMPNLRLMLDSHHMHVEEASVPQALISARELLVHIHLSDTQRLAPGRGGIDFAGLLRTLSALRYDRYLTVEIEQAPDSRAAAADAAGFLHCLLARL